MSLAEQFVGKEVTVVVDRPLGSKHPKHNFVYEINYGYIPDTLAADGEELDAYILDETTPVDEYKGICIGYIHRTNDDDDKLLIVQNEQKKRTEEEIRNITHFQEQRFESEIIFLK